MVYLLTGDKSLKATLAEGRPAEAFGADAKRLLESLTIEVRTQLTRGRGQRLRVIWEPLGNRRQIVALQEG